MHTISHMLTHTIGWKIGRCSVLKSCSQRTLQRDWVSGIIPAGTHVVGCGFFSGSIDSHDGQWVNEHDFE
jgi:hypothetical protein